MVTMSPDSIVSTGLVAALKLPICTGCGLGINGLSAARAIGEPAMVMAARNVRPVRRRRSAGIRTPPRSRLLSEDYSAQGQQSEVRWPPRCNVGRARPAAMLGFITYRQYQAGS